MKFGFTVLIASFGPVMLDSHFNFKFISIITASSEHTQAAVVPHREADDYTSKKRSSFKIFFSSFKTYLSNIIIYFFSNIANF